MTYEELLQDKYSNAPVLCADGNLGMMILLDAHEAGIQVPGEDDIRFIPLGQLHDMGEGALLEKPVDKPLTAAQLRSMFNSTDKFR